MANAGVSSRTRRVSSGLSSSGSGSSSLVKKTASSSRTNSDTPVALILKPSSGHVSVVVLCCLS